MSTAPLFRRILLWGAILAVVIALVGGLVALLIGGWSAAGSALLGAVLAFVFAGATAGSVLLAGVVTRGDMMNPAYFGIIGAAFLVKLVVFLGVVIVLGRAEWVVGAALVSTMVASVLGSLTIDVLVITRSRLAREIDVELPGS
jgi:hypothetical protein